MQYCHERRNFSFVCTMQLVFVLPQRKTLEPVFTAEFGVFQTHRTFLGSSEGLCPSGFALRRARKNYTHERKDFSLMSMIKLIILVVAKSFWQMISLASIKFVQNDDKAVILEHAPQTSTQRANHSSFSRARARSSATRAFRRAAYSAR